MFSGSQSRDGFQLLGKYYWVEKHENIKAKCLEKFRINVHNG